MIGFGQTDIGRVRASNQDAYRFGIFRENAAYAVVCDGMGGANAGNVAGNIGVETVAECLERGFRPGMAAASVRNLMESAIAAANRRIFDAARETPAYAGMGTTLVTAIVRESEATVAHMGDSRAYLFSDGAFKQITRDHSLVQSMLDCGQITESEARRHPDRHMITRALGVEASASADFYHVPFHAGDILLLCTDGLTNFTEPEQISNILRTVPPGDVPGALIAVANAAGGGDNITAVVLYYE